MLGKFYIRYSKEEDVEKVKDLLYSCFGCMVEKQGAFDGISTGRYLLVVEIKTERVIAMSGLCHSKEFDEPQITWTCVDKEYQKQGIMTRLFERFVNSTDQDLYCSCWRIGDNEQINLHYVMDFYDFRKVQENYKIREEGTCEFKEGCPYYKKGCKCFNDVYKKGGTCKECANKSS